MAPVLHFGAAAGGLGIVAGVATLGPPSTRAPLPAVAVPPQGVTARTPHLLSIQMSKPLLISLRPSPLHRLHHRPHELRQRLDAPQRAIPLSLEVSQGPLVHQPHRLLNLRPP